MSKLFHYIFSPNTKSNDFNSTSFEHIRWSPYVILRLAIRHHNQNTAATASSPKQLTFYKAQGSPSSSSSSWISDSVHSFNSGELVAVAVKAENEMRAGREKHDGNADMSRGDMERSNHFLDKVEASFEVPTAVILDTTGAVNQESKIKAFATY